MAKNIEPTLAEIGKYLKHDMDVNFVIPEYQRSYSWDIVQCDKLWQDIEAFINADAKEPYFFGTIIVDCTNINEFNLIDGQQRTTTFLILLKALLLRLNIVIPKLPKDEETEALAEGLHTRRKEVMGILYKAEPEEIPSMLKDHQNVKNKNVVLIENKSINELYRDELKKIIEAENFEDAEKAVHKIPRKQKDNRYTNHFRNFKFFYKKLSEKSDSQLNQFARFFLLKCQIIEIRSWQLGQAITMFNSLNSTGMPLSDADIISAQLYSNVGKEKTIFNDLWKEINKLADELSSRRVLNIDAVLQQFMYISRAFNKEYAKINPNSHSISVDVTTPGLRRYYTDIRKDLLRSPMELCNNLKSIAEKWDLIKDFPIVKLVMRFNENIKLFLSSYLYRFNDKNEITEEKIKTVCECLLRLFTLLELEDTGYSSSKFKTFLFAENIKLVDKNISVEEIKNDFDEHINKNWTNINSIKEAIKDYDKHLVVYLNEYLYVQNKGLKFYLSDNVNVEHIMPASGRNIHVIRETAGIADIEEFFGLVNKIGNKILLEEDINKSISNEWFQSKKQNSISDKRGYKNSKYAIASSLISYPKNIWTKNDIELATDKAAERVLIFLFNLTVPFNE